MAVSTGWYNEAIYRALLGEIDLGAAGSSLKFGLLANTHTINLEHTSWSTNISGDEVTGTNYTAGGVAITGQAIDKIDDSALTAWAGNTQYEVGDLVRPTVANGYVYRCVVAGTSDSTPTEPTWSTVKGRETDEATGTVKWDNIGTSIIRFDFTNPSWAASTITARYGVCYVNGTPGSTDYPIAYIDFGQDESTSNGTFTVTLPGDGMAQVSIS